MIAELGHYALVLALGLALVQAVVPIYGARQNDPVLMSVAGAAAVTQFLAEFIVKNMLGVLIGRFLEGIENISAFFRGAVDSDRQPDKGNTGTAD